MENIYITWHYTSHGIAYFKHILSAFYSKKCSVNDKKILAKGINQDKMNQVFDKKKDGFLFDKIYYLTAKQEVFDKISTRRFKYRRNMLSDEVVLQQKTKHIWEDVINIKQDSIFDDMEYVKKKYSKKEYDLYFSQLWRDMQHNKISDQIKWFTEQSNAAKHYESRFKELSVPIKDIRDTDDISRNLKPIIERLKKKHKNANFFINASLGSNETQVVWHVFSEFDFLPAKTKLLHTYDNKVNDNKHRMMLFDIKELSSKIISEVSYNIKIYKSPKSESLKLAGLKMKKYIKSGFSVLLLGERGIGKTRLAQEQKKQDAKFMDINCAGFTNNQIAQSELFGHVKGAFTGASEDKKGIFEEANGGILFLDEIHHLDKNIQAKLMKAIQTNENNEFTITRFGDTKEYNVKATLVFASNVSIEELRQKLLPDFYDRITQLVIEMPPLRKAKKDIYDNLKRTWKLMRFNEIHKYEDTVEKDEKLLDWIYTLELLGNYRDLQKITIYYKTFLDFDSEIKLLLKQKTAFEFTKNQFENYISFKQNDNFVEHFFNKEKSLAETRKNFDNSFANWLINTHGSAKKAEVFFKEKGEKGVTERTIYNWKKS